jgi:hypothetical protein
MFFWGHFQKIIPSKFSNRLFWFMLLDHGNVCGNKRKLKFFRISLLYIRKIKKCKKKNDHFLSFEFPPKKIIIKIDSFGYLRL